MTFQSRLLIPLMISFFALCASFQAAADTLDSEVAGSPSFEVGTMLKPEALGTERPETIMVAYPGPESAHITFEWGNETGIREFVGDYNESAGAVRRGDSENIADDIQVAPTVSPIPEPGIYAMMGVGLAMLGWVTRRRKVNQSAVV